MAFGVAITLIPLCTVAVLARWLAQINYLTLCGLLAGSMTDPPALAFANNLHPTSEASSLAYATVYPLVMFLRGSSLRSYWPFCFGLGPKGAMSGVLGYKAVHSVNGFVV